LSYCNTAEYEITITTKVRLMMKQTRIPLVLTLLLTAGMGGLCTMPVQADQEDDAMKAAADRMQQSDAFAEELRKKREARRLEAERQTQATNKEVPPPPVAQAPKPVIKKASTSSDAERRAKEAERKAQEAERKAQEAERRAQEAVARMEQAERERQALAEQRAKEEALKAQALALQQQPKSPVPKAKVTDAWSRIPDECRDPVGTAAEIERLCGPMPATVKKEEPKEAKKETTSAVPKSSSQR
jgi:hypothetical protein